MNQIRTVLFLTIIILFLGCNHTQQKVKSNSAISTKVSKKPYPYFQSLLDSIKLKGSILIFDGDKNQYYSNDYAWSQTAKIPASTFKITNSLIALETGVIKNENSMIFWDKTERSVKVWNQDMNFKEAFHKSCLPCYQQIARKIGVDSMKFYLNKLQYPAMTLDDSSLDIFWLDHPNQITQFQQINFLKRLHQSGLDISERTERIFKNMSLVDSMSNSTIEFRAKTGWTYMDDYNNGWYVGYLIKNQNPIFFATNVEPSEAFEMKHFSKSRISLTHIALRQLGYLN